VNDLISSARTIEFLPSSCILEFIFEGRHHRTHGNKMAQHIKETLAAQRTDAVIINLLDYQYVSGNDVLAGLLPALYDKEEKQCRLCCIVAESET